MITIQKDDLDRLYYRLVAMSEEDRLMLDDVATAIDCFLTAKRHNIGMQFVPNRVAALAAVEAALAWERTTWENDS